MFEPSLLKLTDSFYTLSPISTINQGRRGFLFTLLMFLRHDLGCRVQVSPHRHQRPRLRGADNFTCQKHRTFVAEVLDVSQHLLGFLALHSLADAFGGVPGQESGIGVGLSAIGAGAVLDHSPALQAVFRPFLLHEGHVCLEVVVEVERRVGVGRVENSGVGWHLGGDWIVLFGVMVFGFG